MLRLLCALEAFCCISTNGKSVQINQILQMFEMRRLTCLSIDFWVGTPSLPQNPRHFSPMVFRNNYSGPIECTRHGANDMLIDHRISEDDFTVQQYKENFPQLHYPPIRKPKEGKTDSIYISRGTRFWKLNWRWLCSLHFFESKFQHPNSLIQLNKKQYKERTGQFEGERRGGINKSTGGGPQADLREVRALIQKFEELKIIHAQLLWDTIRAKVTELCSMRLHRTMTEIGKFGRKLYDPPLDGVKERVLTSHMGNLNVLLHQYNMIPKSMFEEFFAMDKTLELAAHKMIQSFSRRHAYIKNLDIFQRSGLILEDPSSSQFLTHHYLNFEDDGAPQHIWQTCVDADTLILITLFSDGSLLALEINQQRRYSWHSDKFFLQHYDSFSLSHKELTHVDILIRNKTTRLNEESPYLQTINETIGILLNKSLTIKNNQNLLTISTVIDFIIKNYEDYNVMEFSKRGYPIKEAFDVRDASLAFIEELVRIENYLRSFYRFCHAPKRRSVLKLTLNGKNRYELAGQIGLIDSYIKITREKHDHLITKLRNTHPMFHHYHHSHQVEGLLSDVDLSLRHIQLLLRETN
ncbi:hypothetical protein PSHT_07929 [Puccinia striiformis]|uniref:Uncharacterized protein n=1 Tax=Puccinia striiformis TaxID=27350 RepID=A0A2S4VU07_9BASI|nr:hypothetical protein PSHT_07929 [Puccinia striiformis]